MGPTRASADVTRSPAIVRPPRRQRWLGRVLSGHRKRLTREQRALVKRFLPDFPIFVQSSAEDRVLCGHHWTTVYREGQSSTGVSSKRSSNGSWGREGAAPVASALTQLYDAFYAYLETHSPDLMPIFRASMHVRSKVLVHISAGMRSLLSNADCMTKVLKLTQTHLRVGVRLEHYAALARALFHAMAVSSGPAWTAELKSAWKRLFVHCSVILMAEHRKLQPPKTSVTTKSTKQLIGPGSPGMDDVYTAPKRVSIQELSETSDGRRGERPVVSDQRQPAGPTLPAIGRGGITA